MNNNGIIVFTDGSSLGNPGRGGWGSIIRLPNGNITEIGGESPRATNNEMELRAALEALSFIKKNSGRAIIYTDSKYLVKGITEWVEGWKKRKWLLVSGEPVMNKSLWLEIDFLVKERGEKNPIVWQHIPGHKGIPGNERVDMIASSFSSGDFLELYHGHESEYSVDLNINLDQIKQAVEQKRSQNQRKKLKAYSYVSLVNGAIEVHKTWDHCKTRVSGQPNAKYKKAVSFEDEKEIIKKFTSLK